MTLTNVMYFHKKKRVLEDLPFLIADNLTMSEIIVRKIYITDLTLDLTFFGEVRSHKESGNTVTVSLVNVSVYEYSSSNYLYQQPEISLSGLKNRFYIEETT